MDMGMHMGIDIGIHVCMGMSICIHMSMHMSMYMGMHMGMHMGMGMGMSMGMHVQFTHAHSGMRACTYVHSYRDVYTQMHARTCICKHTGRRLGELLMAQ